MKKRTTINEAQFLQAGKHSDMADHPREQQQRYLVAGSRWMSHADGNMPTIACTLIVSS